MSAHGKRRARLSPLTVAGEVLLLCGLMIIGYIFWQPWYTTTVVTSQQAKLTAETAAVWRAQAQAEAPTVQPGQPPAKWDGEVPVAAKVAPNDVFAVIYIPSFGSTFANHIAEGTAAAAVLNRADRGIGRYTDTQMPGAPGNVALAAHRSGPFTTPFRDIMSLRVGDPIFIETAEGWYTYRFRSLEYVLPDAVDVLLPFPRLSGVPGDDKILTLTTCHPENWSTAERAIAYSVFEQFQPSSMGPPQELLKINPGVGGA